MAYMECPVCRRSIKVRSATSAKKVPDHVDIRSGRKCGSARIKKARQQTERTGLVQLTLRGVQGGWWRWTISGQGVEIDGDLAPSKETAEAEGREAAERANEAGGTHDGYWESICPGITRRVPFGRSSRPRTGELLRL